MSRDPAPGFGAQWLGDGRTRFALWAPDASAVSVEIEGRDACRMAAVGEGWFEATRECTPGTAYRYVLADGRAVPDPASRAQRGGVHGWSVVTDPHAYRWMHAQWRGRPWTQTVLYEVHAGCYGGFRGLCAELENLARLGITAIELMPVAAFPGARNWGYDGVLPFAPAEAYGTPDDLKALVDTAHGLGLMMFLDVVYNHFGPDGNHLGAYAQRFFRDDHSTPWGAGIDYRRHEVRAFFQANARYWIEEFRFDGLRFDAVHAIGDDDWLREMAQDIRTHLPSDRHVHLVLENDDNQAALLGRGGYDAQWNDDFHHALHVLLTGEADGYYAAYAQCPAEHLARCLAQGFAYQGEDAPGLDRARGTPSTHLPPHAFVAFLQNHDQVGNRALGERLSVLADAQALRAATALLLLSPMIPLLFMGEDVGALEPFLYFTDHEPALAQKVRDGRRQEFARFPAFSDPGQRARIPDPNAAETFARVQVRAASDAIEQREFVRMLLALRHRVLVPQLHDARSLGAQVLGAAAVCARWRLASGQVLHLACNLGTTPVAHATPTGECLYAGPAPFDAQAQQLPARCTAAWLCAAPEAAP